VAGQLLVFFNLRPSISVLRRLRHSIPMPESKVQSRQPELEEQFRLMVESVKDYAIYMLDPQGRITTWNPGAERIKGYRAEEIIGQHFSRFYPPEDVARGVPEHNLQIAAAEGRLESESWRIRKDGSRFWADVVITALRDAKRELTGFAKITRDLTERREMEQALRELSGQLLRVQDEERRRIGRDLHDNVGQYLVTLKMHIDSVEPVFEPDEGTRQKLQMCSRLAEELLREIRTTSYELYPPMLEEVGLTSAVPWYLDGFMERSGIETTFELSPGFGRPARDTELAMFRVIQESLTNVRRHSASRTAKVRLVMNDHEYELEVSDEGNGIRPEILEAFHQARGKLGVGLRGMQHRMRQLGGELEVLSAGKGTVVRATVPRNKSR
jgi:PAS domain S-box-containing protein